MKKKQQNKPSFYGEFVRYTELGELSNYGLCNSLPYELLNTNAFALISPTIEDQVRLDNEDKSSMYWGSGISRKSWNKYISNKHIGLTPLRQTLLLLAACLNGEKF